MYSIDMISIEELERFCDHLTRDSLLLFDVDMVLTQPEESAYQLPNLARHASVLQEMIIDLPPATKDLLACLTMTSCSSILVEDHAPKYIQSLQSKLPVIALTAALTGSIEHIPSLEDWRFETLSNLGIDFSKAFQTNQKIVFDQLSSHRNNYPVFDRGILYANGEQGKHKKGDVLVHFLKAFNLRPKSVILVDDRKLNLRLVHQALYEYDKNCQFIGLHYQGSLHYQSRPLSEEVCKRKIQKLVELAVRMDKNRGI